MIRKAVIKRAAAWLAALVIVFSSAGCGEQPLPAQTEQTGQTEQSEQSSAVTPAPTAQTAESSTPEAQPLTQEAPTQSESAQPADPTAEPSADPGDTAETEAPQDTAPTEEQTAPPEQTTTQEITSPPATTTEPKPPAPVVIPEVKIPLSPGKSVFEESGLVIDYTNSALGYISVCYTGASDKTKLRLINGDATYDHGITPGGGTEYIPLTLGNGNYTLQFYERVEGKMYSMLLDTQMSVNVADDIAMYLYPNKYSMFDKNSACVKKAAELCAGADSTVEKVAAIFAWVTDNVTYDYDLAATVTSGYVSDPDRTLSRKMGICFDYASLTAAMTRSQGIPTRLVIGYATDIYHAWNEVWTEETGWITPELLLAKKGFNRIDATFYSSNANKQKISDFISDNGNYSAVYYY